MGAGGKKTCFLKKIIGKKKQKQKNISFNSRNHWHQEFQLYKWHIQLQMWNINNNRHNNIILIIRFYLKLYILYFQCSVYVTQGWIHRTTRGSLSLKIAGLEKRRQEEGRSTTPPQKNKTNKEKNKTKTRQLPSAAKGKRRWMRCSVAVDGRRWPM